MYDVRRKRERETTERGNENVVLEFNCSATLCGFRSHFLRRQEINSFPVNSAHSFHFRTLSNLQPFFFIKTKRNQVIIFYTFFELYHCRKCWWRTGSGGCRTLRAIRAVNSSVSWLDNRAVTSTNNTVICSLQRRPNRLVCRFRSLCLQVATFFIICISQLSI